MFSKVNSAGLFGVQGYVASVEADVSDGLPAFVMSGYLAAEVREAQDRVRTALRNSGFRLLSKKITINFSPAGVRKEGTGFDLAVGVAVLCAFGILDHEQLEKSLFVGELGLDGNVKPVRGILPRVQAARKAGLERVYLPEDNGMEGAVVQGIQVVGVRDLRQLTDWLLEPSRSRVSKFGWEQAQQIKLNHYEVDFSEVNGQKLLRRAAEVAVAGMHHILFVGPAGTGKTMVAKRLPTIMPPISMEESVEISKVYSICGMLAPEMPLVTRRPFRSPHHSITAQALIGGGAFAMPGEISLASRGILFLDELAEYRRTLDLLRQPLEDGKVTIARCRGTYEYPADCMVVAAMNPCRCGFYPDRNRCRCTEHQIKDYLGKISRPLLDRIDICVEAAPVTFDELTKEGRNEDSETIRRRVEKAIEIQRDRFQDLPIRFNCQMGRRELERYCTLRGEGEGFLKKVYQTLSLSARSYGRILKVARTVADLEGAKEIERNHISEAVGYCSLKEKYWGR